MHLQLYARFDFIFEKNNVLSVQKYTFPVIWFDENVELCSLLRKWYQLTLSFKSVYQKL